MADQFSNENWAMTVDVLMPNKNSFSVFDKLVKSVNELHSSNAVSDIQNLASSLGDLAGNKTNIDEIVTSLKSMKNALKDVEKLGNAEKTIARITNKLTSSVASIKGTMELTKNHITSTSKVISGLVGDVENLVKAANTAGDQIKAAVSGFSEAFGEIKGNKLSEMISNSFKQSISQLVPMINSELAKGKIMIPVAMGGVGGTTSGGGTSSGGGSLSKEFLQELSGSIQEYKKLNTKTKKRSAVEDQLEQQLKNNANAIKEGARRSKKSHDAQEKAIEENIAATKENSKAKKRNTKSVNQNSRGADVNETRGSPSGFPKGVSQVSSAKSLSTQQEKFLSANLSPSVAKAFTPILESLKAMVPGLKLKSVPGGVSSFSDKTLSVAKDLKNHPVFTQLDIMAHEVKHAIDIFTGAVPQTKGQFKSKGFKKVPYEQLTDVFAHIKSAQMGGKNINPSKKYDASYIPGSGSFLKEMTKRLSGGGKLDPYKPQDALKILQGIVGPKGVLSESPKKSFPKAFVKEMKDAIVEGAKRQAKESGNKAPSASKALKEFVDQTRLYMLELRQAQGQTAFYRDAGPSVDTSRRISKRQALQTLQESFVGPGNISKKVSTTAVDDTALRKFVDTAASIGGVGGRSLRGMKNNLVKAITRIEELAAVNALTEKELDGIVKGLVKGKLPRDKRIDIEADPSELPKAKSASSYAKKQAREAKNLKQTVEQTNITSNMQKAVDAYEDKFGAGQFKKLSQQSVKGVQGSAALLYEQFQEYMLRFELEMEEVANYMLKQGGKVKQQSQKTKNSMKKLPENERSIFSPYFRAGDFGPTAARGYVPQNQAKYNDTEGLTPQKRKSIAPTGEEAAKYRKEISQLVLAGESRDKIIQTLSARRMREDFGFTMSHVNKARKIEKDPKASERQIQEAGAIKEIYNSITAAIRHVVRRGDITSGAEEFSTTKYARELMTGKGFRKAIGSKTDHEQQMMSRFLSGELPAILSQSEKETMSRILPLMKEWQTLLSKDKDIANLIKANLKKLFTMSAGGSDKYQRAIEATPGLESLAGVKGLAGLMARTTAEVGPAVYEAKTPKKKGSNKVVKGDTANFGRAIEAFGKEEFDSMVNDVLQGSYGSVKKLQNAMREHLLKFSVPYNKLTKYLASQRQAFDFYKTGKFQEMPETPSQQAKRQSGATIAESVPGFEDVKTSKSGKIRRAPAGQSYTPAKVIEFLQNKKLLEKNEYGNVSAKLINPNSIGNFVTAGTSRDLVQGSKEKSYAETKAGIDRKFGVQSYEKIYGDDKEERLNQTIDSKIASDIMSEEKSRELVGKSGMKKSFGVQAILDTYKKIFATTSGQGSEGITFDELLQGARQVAEGSGEKHERIQASKIVKDIEKRLEAFRKSPKKRKKADEFLAAQAFPSYDILEEVMTKKVSDPQAKKNTKKKEMARKAREKVYEQINIPQEEREALVAEQEEERKKAEAKAEKLRNSKANQNKRAIKNLEKKISILNEGIKAAKQSFKTIREQTRAGKETGSRIERSRSDIENIANVVNKYGVTPLQLARKSEQQIRAGDPNVAEMDKKLKELYKEREKLEKEAAKKKAERDKRNKEKADQQDTIRQTRAAAASVFDETEEPKSKETKKKKSYPCTYQGCGFVSKSASGLASHMSAHARREAAVSGGTAGTGGTGGTGIPSGTGGTGGMPDFGENSPIMLVLRTINNGVKEISKALRTIKRNLSSKKKDSVLAASGKKDVPIITAINQLAEVIKVAKTGLQVRDGEGGTRSLTTEEMDLYNKNLAKTKEIKKQKSQINSINRKIERRDKKIAELRKEQAKITSALKAYQEGLSQATEKEAEAKKKIAKNTEAIISPEKARLSLTKQNIDATAKEQAGVSKLISSAFRRVTLWGSASFAIYTLVFKIKDAVQTMKQFEKSVVDVTKVMPSFLADNKAIADSARDIAKAFGRNLIETTDAMRIFAQQGKDMSSVIQLTRAAALAANVTLLSTTEATEALTAATKQFSIADQDAINVINSWNEVSNRNAITAKALAEALRHSGTAAKNAGLSIHELNGMITALVSATRQSGSQVGRGLKFLFSHIVTPDAIKALQAANIAVYKQNGEFRKGVDILTELANRWDTLSNVERHNIALKVAGTRRYNNLLVLMSRWDDHLKAVSDSMDAEGSAMIENQKIMDTFTKNIDRLGASWDSFVTAIGESGVTKGLSNMTSALTSIVGLFDMLPDTLKGVAATGGLVGGLGLTAAHAVSYFGLGRFGSGFGGFAAKQDLKMEAMKNTEQVKSQQTLYRKLKLQYNSVEIEKKHLALLKEKGIAEEQALQIRQKAYASLLKEQGLQQRYGTGVIGRTKRIGGGILGFGKENKALSTSLGLMVAGSIGESDYFSDKKSVTGKNIAGDVLGGLGQVGSWVLMADLLKGVLGTLRLFPSVLGKIVPVVGIAVGAFQALSLAYKRWGDSAAKATLYEKQAQYWKEIANKIDSVASAYDNLIKKAEAYRRANQQVPEGLKGQISNAAQQFARYVPQVAEYDTTEGRLSLKANAVEDSRKLIDTLRKTSEINKDAAALQMVNVRGWSDYLTGGTALENAGADRRETLGNIVEIGNKLREAQVAGNTEEIGELVVQLKEENKKLDESNKKLDNISKTVKGSFVNFGRQVRDNALGRGGDVRGVSNIAWQSLVGLSKGTGNRAAAESIEKALTETIGGGKGVRYATGEAGREEFIQKLTFALAEGKDASEVYYRTITDGIKKGTYQLNQWDLTGKKVGKTIELATKKTRVYGDAVDLTSANAGRIMTSFDSIGQSFKALSAASTLVSQRLSKRIALAKEEAQIQKDSPYSAVKNTAQILDYIRDSAIGLSKLTTSLYSVDFDQITRTTDNLFETMRTKTGKLFSEVSGIAIGQIYGNQESPQSLITASVTAKNIKEFYKQTAKEQVSLIRNQALPSPSDTGEKQQATDQRTKDLQKLLESLGITVADLAQKSDKDIQSAIEIALQKYAKKTDDDLNKYIKDLTQSSVSFIKEIRKGMVSLVQRDVLRAKSSGQNIAAGGIKQTRAEEYLASEIQTELKFLGGLLKQDDISKSVKDQVRVSIKQLEHQDKWAKKAVEIAKMQAQYQQAFVNISRSGDIAGAQTLNFGGVNYQAFAKTDEQLRILTGMKAELEQIKSKAEKGSDAEKDAAERLVLVDEQLGRLHDTNKANLHNLLMSVEKRWADNKQKKINLTLAKAIGGNVFSAQRSMFEGQFSGLQDVMRKMIDENIPLSEATSSRAKGILEFMENKLDPDKRRAYAFASDAARVMANVLQRQLDSGVDPSNLSPSMRRAIDQDRSGLLSGIVNKAVQKAGAGEQDIKEISSQIKSLTDSLRNDLSKVGPDAGKAAALALFSLLGQTEEGRSSKEFKGAKDNIEKQTQLVKLDSESVERDKKKAAHLESIDKKLDRTPGVNSGSTTTSGSEQHKLAKEGVEKQKEQIGILRDIQGNTAVLALGIYQRDAKLAQRAAKSFGSSSVVNTDGTFKGTPGRDNIAIRVGGGERVLSDSEVKAYKAMGVPGFASGSRTNKVDLHKDRGEAKIRDLRARARSRRMELADLEQTRRAPVGSPTAQVSDIPRIRQIQEAQADAIKEYQRALLGRDVDSRSVVRATKKIRALDQALQAEQAALSKQSAPTQLKVQARKSGLFSRFKRMFGLGGADDFVDDIMLSVPKDRSVTWPEMEEILLGNKYDPNLPVAGQPFNKKKPPKLDSNAVLPPGAKAGGMSHDDAMKAANSKMQRQLAAEVRVKKSTYNTYLKNKDIQKAIKQYKRTLAKNKVTRNLSKVLSDQEAFNTLFADGKLDGIIPSGARNTIGSYLKVKPASLGKQSMFKSLLKLPFFKRFGSKSMIKDLNEYAQFLGIDSKVVIENLPKNIRGLYDHATRGIAISDRLFKGEAFGTLRHEGFHRHMAKMPKPQKEKFLLKTLRRLTGHSDTKIAVSLDKKIKQYTKYGRSLDKVGALEELVSSEFNKPNNERVLKEILEGSKARRASEAAQRKASRELIKSPHGKTPLGKSTIKKAIDQVDATINMAKSKGQKIDGTMVKRLKSSFRKEFGTDMYDVLESEIDDKIRSSSAPKKGLKRVTSRTADVLRAFKEKGGGFFKGVKDSLVDRFPGGLMKRPFNPPIDDVLPETYRGVGLTQKTTTAKIIDKVKGIPKTIKDKLQETLFKPQVLKGQPLQIRNFTDLLKNAYSSIPKNVVQKSTKAVSDVAGGFIEGVTPFKKPNIAKPGKIRGIARGGGNLVKTMAVAIGSDMALRGLENKLRESGNEKSADTVNLLRMGLMESPAGYASLVPGVGTAAALGLGVADYGGALILRQMGMKNVDKLSASKMFEETIGGIIGEAVYGRRDYETYNDISLDQKNRRTQTASLQDIINAKGKLGSPYGHAMDVDERYKVRDIFKKAGVSDSDANTLLLGFLNKGSIKDHGNYRESAKNYANAYLMYQKGKELKKKQDIAEHEKKVEEIKSQGVAAQQRLENNKKKDAMEIDAMKKEQADFMASVRERDRIRREKRANKYAAWDEDLARYDNTLKGARRVGGYIQESGNYSLHRGEGVFSPEDMNVIKQILLNNNAKGSGTSDDFSKSVETFRQTILDFSNISMVGGTPVAGSGQVEHSGNIEVSIGQDVTALLEELRSLISQASNAPILTKGSRVPTSREV